MKTYKHTIAFICAAFFAAVSTASAHIGYTGRDFGVFSATGSESPVLITSNTATGNYGWASGTDANLGDSHKLRAFRFTLLNTGIITLEVQGLDIIKSGVPVSALAHPGFSIYKGLAHLPPAQADHDASFISTLYNDTTYGTGNWQGSFNALADWKIGSDDGLTFADLSSFTYVGNAADGTSALFGAAPGINGDGNADGTVSESFVLSAGDYSIFVGGAEYFGSSNTAAGVSGSNFAFNTTLSVAVIPEPSTYALFVLGAMVMYGIRFRKSDQGRF